MNCWPSSAWHCGRLFGFSDIWTYIRCSRCSFFFWPSVVLKWNFCLLMMRWNYEEGACEWIPGVLLWFCG